MCSLKHNISDVQLKIVLAVKVDTFLITHRTITMNILGTKNIMKPNLRKKLFYINNFP